MMYVRYSLFNNTDGHETVLNSKQNYDTLFTLTFILAFEQNKLKTLLE